MPRTETSATFSIVMDFPPELVVPVDAEPDAEDPEDTLLGSAFQLLLWKTPELNPSAKPEPVLMTFSTVFFSMGEELFSDSSVDMVLGSGRGKTYW